MQGPRTLFEYEDRWVTRLGAWVPGERVVLRGKDLFQELQDLSWMALLLFGITGSIPSQKQVRLFEGIWRISASFPDPRLWNNRVAALAGTARSTGSLATSAAIAVSEASIYGQQPLVRVMDFLLRAQEHLNCGKRLIDFVESELEKTKVIAGYGRPIVANDERIAPLIALANELGFADGPYVRLAFETERILLAGRRRLRMNVAAVAAALAADQGLTVQQFYAYTILWFSAGIIPCARDALDKPEGAFFPLRCSRIQYSGRGRRSWEEIEQGSAQL